MVITIRDMHHDKPKQFWDFRVDRASPIGNPYKLGVDGTRQEVCDMYDAWFKDHCDDEEVAAYLHQIIDAHKKYGGVNLFCWCVPLRCHAGTIKRWLEKQLDLKT